MCAREALFALFGFAVIIVRVGKRISEGHYAVAEVNVFHRRVLMCNLYIVKAEIPESRSTQLDKLVRKLLSSSFGYAQYRYLRLFLLKKAFHLRYGYHAKSRNNASCL